MTIQNESDRLSTANAMKAFDSLPEDKKNYLKGFIACAALDSKLNNTEETKDERSDQPSDNK